MKVKAKCRNCGREMELEVPPEAADMVESFASLAVCNQCHDRRFGHLTAPMSKSNPQTKLPYKD